MLCGSVTLRAQLRPAAPLAAARAGSVSLRAAPRCVASVSAQRLPATQVRRVALDGAAAGEATLALKTAKEATAVGLVHRYLVLVRQNARRVRRRARAGGLGQRACRPARYANAGLPRRAAPAADTAA